MEPSSPWSSERLHPNTPVNEQNKDDESQMQSVGGHVSSTRKIDKNFIAALDTVKTRNVRIEVATMEGSQEGSQKGFFQEGLFQEGPTGSQSKKIIEDKLTDIDLEDQDRTDKQKVVMRRGAGPSRNRLDGLERISLPVEGSETSIETFPTSKLAVPETPVPDEDVQAEDTQEQTASLSNNGLDTGKVPTTQVSTTQVPPSPSPSPSPHLIPLNAQRINIKRGTAMLLIALLAVVVLQGLMIGPTQFLGVQGWASVLGSSVAQGNPNLLKNIQKQITHPGTTAAVKVQMTPDQYIDLIVNRMTLDQKLGQMMIVQFVGPTYSLPISTMLSQYNVGAVLVFTANGNVVDKDQLKSLIKQMKDASTTIPLAVAIDQEGGSVDRLVNLDGPRPAAATIGATNDPTQARQAGIQDAKDLTSYGFNLNLAPVVDVTNVYNAQMYGRTFGDTPQQVTKMAGAYLQGLQKSGKVVGTLKHFPGLGDVSTDPHLAIPELTRSLSDLEKIDWAPYRALIKSGNVHALMVTHELVDALDTSEPSSLSSKVIQGILRKDLGFQGVVMTDSLTMDALTAYATMAQAAVLSIEAGADLLMGASSPDDVASMFQSIKQAMSTGAITQQRINQSVHRLLMMKYEMGLLPVPMN
jgi:beta-N-acetylhexosaminidase